jgi:hypothetical protein
MFRLRHTEGKICWDPGSVTAKGTDLEFVVDPFGDFDKEI